MTKTADTNGTCNNFVDCSLREAIKAANDETNNPGADTIAFASFVSGAINLNSPLPTISTDMALRGPGANLLEVTRTGGVFRIFTLSNGTSSGPTVSISGIAITNGYANTFESTFGFAGGGVYNDSGTLTISNCTVSDNTAIEAGGIFSRNGTLIVLNSTFSGNTSHDTDVGFGEGLGGGIYSVGGTATVSNCTLSGNSAKNGGGIFSRSGTLIVLNSTFSGNSTSDSAGVGGGIGSNNGILTVRNCTLSGNSAIDDGGGIYNTNGTLTVSNSTLSGNSASNAGGGIANVGTNSGVANATVSNSTLSGNSASNGGGGIDNTGTNGGNAFVKLNNTVLASTSDMPGANLVNTGLGTSITSEGYNLSSDDGGGFLFAAGDQNNTNPKLGSLQDNGGPTQTMALLAGSPAQDQGKNFGVTTDQRGLPRPIDNPAIANAVGGDGSDIGAVEMDAPQGGPSFIVTTTADHDDGSCSFDDCTLREAVHAANAQAGANTITFAANVTGTITLQAALGELDVTDSITISGPGARVLAVSGNGASAVFFCSSGTSTMSGLTIRDGAVIGAAGLTGLSARGGGIYNARNATLTLSDCTLSGNRVQGGDNTSPGGAGGQGNGGALGNSGVLTLNRCTFSGNSAAGGRGGDGGTAMGDLIVGGQGGAGRGGAVFNDLGATLTINNCTFSGNSGSGGAGGTGHISFGGTGGTGSGGIFNGSSLLIQGTMLVSACTFNGNTGSGGAGGTGSNIFNHGAPGAGSGGLTAAAGGSNTVRDTISAGNLGSGSGGPDVDGTFTSGGYNLIGIGDSSTGFTGTGDQVGTTAAPLNANLGPLQDNDGPTQTIALLCGSPAIDQGTSNGLTDILTTDQRGTGFARTFDDAAITNATGGDGTDVGAFELQQSCTSPGPCAGDCDDNTEVTVDELLTMINVALGSADVSLCPAGNVNRDDEITVDEILTAVNNALNGCPVE